MPRALPPEIRVECQALYASGFTPKAIAEKYKEIGLSKATVSKWILRGRWRETRDKVAGVAGTALKESVQKSLTELSRSSRQGLAEAVGYAVELLKANPPTAEELANRPSGEGRASVLKRLVDAASELHDWDQQRPTGLILAVDLGQPDAAETVDGSAPPLLPEAV